MMNTSWAEFRNAISKHNKKEYQAFARKVLAESGADHVVYCYIDYEDGEPTLARFHSGLKMDDDEFYKETCELTGDFYVGAAHRLK